MGIKGMFLPAAGEGARLLEIGCGNGGALKYMRELGWDVSGVEYDPACKDMVEKQGIACRLGDIREQHYTIGSFDAIYTGNVIEHVEDPTGFVAECCRVIKRGGHLVIVTPNILSAGHRLFTQDWRGLEPPRHLQIFNLKNLSTLVAKQGFEVHVARTTNRGAWYIWGISKLIRRARLLNRSMDGSKIRLVSLDGMITQIFARFVALFARDAGEELIVLATKK